MTNRFFRQLSLQIISVSNLNKHVYTPRRETSQRCSHTFSKVHKEEWSQTENFLLNNTSAESRFVFWYYLNSLGVHKIWNIKTYSKIIFSQVHFHQNLCEMARKIISMKCLFQHYIYNFCKPVLMKQFKELFTFLLFTNFHNNMWWQCPCL